MIINVPATDDGCRISAHLANPPLKLSTAVTFEGVLISQTADKKQQATATTYLQDLSALRSACLSRLDSSAANTEIELLEAAEAYISALLGLVNNYTQAINSAPELDEQTDARLQALLGSGPARVNKLDEAAVISQQMPGNALARRAVPFQWQDVLLIAGPSSASDTVYELASILIAVAVWQQRRAVYLCQGGKAGSSSDAAIKAYNLLRCAGGIYQFVQTKCVPLLANICLSVDCSPQVVQGYTQLALADAQSITVLRAIQKGNAPSLIAALAHDTANMYQAAAQAFKQVASTSKLGSKQGRYAEWKLLVFQGYMYAFTGLTHLSNHEGGKAVWCADEARSLSQSASKAAGHFDKAAPASLPADHAQFDAAFIDCVSNVYNKCKRENDTIFYNHIPEELPSPPPPKKLATPTEYQLPPLSAEVSAGAANAFHMPADQAFGSAAPQLRGSAEDQASISRAGTSHVVASQPGQPAGSQQAGASDDQSSVNTACWRWLLVIVALPLLAIVSVVGVVVWIVLLPLKCFCCPIGMVAQLIWDVFEWLIKAPLRGLLWASGKPWKPVQASKFEKQHSQKTTSPV